MSLQKNCVRRGWFVGLAFGARALGAVVALGVLWPLGLCGPSGLARCATLLSIMPTKTSSVNNFSEQVVI